jgi:hypothetical protein
MWGRKNDWTDTSYLGSPSRKVSYRDVFYKEETVLPVVVKNHTLKIWRISWVVTQDDSNGTAQIGSEVNPIFTADQNVSMHELAHGSEGGPDRRSKA